MFPHHHLTSSTNRLEGVCERFSEVTSCSTAAPIKKPAREGVLISGEMQSVAVKADYATRPLLRNREAIVLTERSTLRFRGVVFLTDRIGEPRVGRSDEPRPLCQSVSSGLVAVCKGAHEGVRLA